VGKAPASASANREARATSSKSAAKPTNLSDSGKILASVTELAKVRKTKQLQAKAKPARPQKTKARIAAVGATAAAGRRIFERLSPEAARFRAYSRRRRAILISVIGSFTALVLLMLASMYTPMLAVESIRITGTSRLKVAQLQSALKSRIAS
jgi:cell division protein FtsQ